MLILFLLLNIIWLNFGQSAMNITQPGNYAIGQEIQFNASAADDTLIIIDSDNVNLDLSGHTIAQSNTVDGVHGIIINSGHNNITVKNGVIYHVTGSGVVVNDNCENIMFQDLVINSCGNGATMMNMNGTTNGIRNVLIERCIITDCISRLIVRISNCSGIYFGSCNLNNNTSPLALIGISLSNVTNGVFDSIIIANNNSPSNFTGVNAASSSQEWKNCYVLGNSTATTLNGIVMIGNSNVHDCYVVGNTAPASSLTGLLMVTGGSRSLLENSISLGNQASDIIGFDYLAVQKHLSINNISAHNTATNSVSGYRLFNSSNIYVKDAISHTQNGTTVNGYLLNGTSSNNVLDETVASSIETGTGFNDNGLNIFIKNVASFDATAYAGLAASQYNIDFADNVNSFTSPWTNVGTI